MAGESALLVAMSCFETEKTNNKLSLVIEFSRANQDFRCSHMIFQIS
jgi:hypothetical protein